MADIKSLEDIILVGISLVGEDRINQCKKTSNSSNLRVVDDVIGVLTLKTLQVNLEDVKITMAKQLLTLPPHFIFLTKEGWPIMKNQEPIILVSQILTTDKQIQIKRHSDPPRIAIRVKNKDIIGFAYIDLSSSAFTVRRTIEQQLSDCSFPFLSSFGFLDKNSWPVTPKQEDRLIGWDIQSCGVITIYIPDENIPTFSAEVLDSGPSKRKRSNCSSSESMQTMMYHDENLPSDTNEIMNGGSSNGNKVLISYARCDAKNHAEALKQELIDLGFSVFLDVDDIPGGADWLDALNTAVCDCAIFVCLVTENYGETKWTSREVKLADKLRKRIIPVNFLDKWPPDCLAILFCSLNFIPWKTKEETERELAAGGDRARVLDVRFWNQPYVQRVAADIHNCYEKSLNILDTELMQSVPQLSQASDEHSQTMSDGFSLPDVQVDGQPPLSIVISVHPNQKLYGEELKTMLTDMGYSVWCTTELLDSMDSSADETSSVSGSSPATPVTPMEKGAPLFPSSSQESTCSLYGPKMSGSNRFQRSPDVLEFCRQDRGSSTFKDIWKDIGKSTMSLNQKIKLHIFRRYVDNAQVVIFVISNSFCNSRMCYKQARYCDFRKHVLAIKYEKELVLPTWMEMMFGDDFIQCSREGKPTKKELKKHIDSLAKTMQKDSIYTLNEERTLDIVSNLKRELEDILKGRITIYIAGSTTFTNPKSQSICQQLGCELATLSFVTLITGGFFGVSELVARNFCEERGLLGKPDSLYHIIPNKDKQDLKQKIRQRKDGTFEKLPFGHTIFAGDSIKERDSVVAQLFDYCIIIEGGPGTAHEAENFMWNDHTIIPIKCTGGAASGKFGLPPKLLEVPAGVDEEDWSLLERRDITSEAIAKAVVRIVCDLYDNRGRRKSLRRKLREKTALTKSYSVR